MNSREQHLTTLMQTVLPSFSSRTFSHPSFMSLYAGFPHSRTEVFYNDPSMDCGRRIYNRLRGQRVFDGFQLNTPPPIMSSCLAPPNTPDPFRFGPHPTRDLGSPTWRFHTTHFNPSMVQHTRLVLQLDQEEDQAITNLLTLHYHHQSLESDEGFTAQHMDFYTVTFPDYDAVYQPVCLRGGRLGWSDTELEVANTLSSLFDMKENLNTDICCPPDIKEDSDSSEDLLEMKIRLLSDLEGVAVLMLLSLGDMGVLDVV